MGGRRSTSGQRRKVEEARRIARKALGNNTRVDQPSRYVPSVQETKPAAARNESVGVLTIGEVAARWGIARSEVERMIAAGKLRALPTGYTVTVPSSEVERFRPPGKS